MSGNLGLTLIAESQPNKHTTANTALLRLGEALSNILGVSVASGNATLTANQYQTAVHIQIVDVGTAGRTVTLPAIERGMVLVSSHGDNTESVDVVRGSATLTLLPGEVAICSTDGTANGLAGYVLADSGAPPTLESLIDVVLIAPANGDVLKYDSETGMWVNGAAAGGVATTFLGLTDTPASYSGAGGYAVRVNSGATGLELVRRGGEIQFSFAGTMSNAEALYRHHTRTAWTLLASSGNSPKCTAGAAATGSTTVTLRKNGSSIGTLVWSAAGTTATITISSAVSFSADDIFTIEGPATADATLANVAGALPFAWN